MPDKTNTTANRRSAGYAGDLLSIFSRLVVPGTYLSRKDRDEIRRALNPCQKDHR